jgi:hypothetical protein
MHRQQFRVSILSLALAICAPVLYPSLGSASDDCFGSGDGHHGAKSVAAAEVIHRYSRVAFEVAVDDTSVSVADGSKFSAGEGGIAAFFATGTVTLAGRVTATGFPTSSKMTASAFQVGVALAVTWG